MPRNPHQIGDLAMLDPLALALAGTAARFYDEAPQRRAESRRRLVRRRRTAAPPVRLTPSLAAGQC
jgi:hypothetical protein